MKIQYLPTVSAADLERKLPSMPAGTALTVTAENGAVALAVKLNAGDFADTGRLHAALGTALTLVNDPRTPKMLGQFTGLAKDAKSLSGLMAPDNNIPFGSVLDGLAIVTSSVSFWHAVRDGKGTLHVTVAGAEVLTNVVEAVWKTPETQIAGLLVRGVGKAVAISDTAAIVPKT